MSIVINLKVACNPDYRGFIQIRVFIFQQFNVFQRSLPNNNLYDSNNCPNYRPVYVLYKHVFTAVRV